MQTEKTVTATNENFTGKPLYTSGDYAIVREGLAKLTRREKAIVVQRYWEGLSLSEIADGLSIEWHEARTALESAHSKLKKLCLANPGFSRCLKVLKVA